MSNNGQRALRLDWRLTPDEKRRREQPPLSFGEWSRRMESAGWQFWLWIDDSIMWRHADEYAAALSVWKARDYYKAGKVPDVYDVMRALYG